MKNLLIVGSNSFLAKKYLNLCKQDRRFITLARSGNPDIKIDLREPHELESMKLSKDQTPLDGILFFQGLSPSLSAKNADWQRMTDMFTVNLSAPIFLIKALHKKLNKGACVIFFSSIAVEKGSYDPSYAAAKSALYGLINSLSNEFPNNRFNAIKLGLVDGSPVEENMTDDYRQKHKARMFKNRLIEPETVVESIDYLLRNANINRAILSIDGGYRT